MNLVSIASRSKTFTFLYSTLSTLVLWRMQLCIEEVLGITFTVGERIFFEVDRHMPQIRMCGHTQLAVHTPSWHAPGYFLYFVRIWTYVCMYICMYICMYVCVYACMYVCMYLCMYVYMYVCIMYVCMHLCMYVFMYVCMYVRMFVCMYVL